MTVNTTLRRDGVASLIAMDDRVLRRLVLFETALETFPDDAVLG
ncbi:hypothetical protein [Natronococcus occultus]|uniref:Uncharacterized protein n=1 Tax=Natronococcus occultus SP4 TaxID=694430 RepID=L0K317_9EURY|nr:hypothetical protein [Natronococcus occultus]AGB39386.1 hypothetical protein Natoc_3670 [Natronococcus occultus SP4]